MKITWECNNKNSSLRVESEVRNMVEMVKMVCKLERCSEAFEADKDVDLFASLAKLDNNDLLKLETCGKCGKGSIKHVVRETKGDDGEVNEYYELHCSSCYAKLPYGVHKKGGGLYAKRRDKETKQVRGVNGWVKYNRDTGKEE